MNKKLYLIAALGALLLSCSHQSTPRPEEERKGFVNVTDIVPDAILEIRYYSTYNFVGDRIDGYTQPVALLTRQAADSLRAVSEELKGQGYRLKIWDAYRPQRAVNHFIRWAENLSDTSMKAVFYPMVDKSMLFEQGYIYARSSHSRGSTVDLTLIEASTGKEVDMGSPFDWFGIESHPDYCGTNPDTTLYPEIGKYIGDGTGLSEQQFNNRWLLRSAMLRHGFIPIDSEWWHFTLREEPYPDTYFDFPVKQL